MKRTAENLRLICRPSIEASLWCCSFGTMCEKETEYHAAKWLEILLWFALQWSAPNWHTSTYFFPYSNTRCIQMNQMANDVMYESMCCYVYFGCDCNFKSEIMNHIQKSNEPAFVWFILFIMSEYVL